MKLQEYAQKMRVTEADAADQVIREQGIKYNAFGLTDNELCDIAQIVLDRGKCSPNAMATIIRGVTSRMVTLTPPRKAGWAGHQRAARIVIEEPND